MANNDDTLAHARGSRSRSNGTASIWDSENYSAVEAYEQLRARIGAGPSPWTIEQSEPVPFRARFENFIGAGGMFGRCKCVSMQSIRSKSDVERSSDHLLYVLYALSGSVAIEQAGRTNLAREGDLITIDGALPARAMNVAGDGRRCASQLGIVISKSALHDFDDIEFFRNSLLPRERIPAPLSSLLNYMSIRLISASQDELRKLFQAAVHLLPLAADGLRDGDTMRALSGSFRPLAAVIEDNLTNPLLSAEYAALKLRCSVRYVHKVFCSMGTTFGAYVTERRLDFARADLVSAGSRIQISAIAYKWGFKDLSTFNRAFKWRFGCTPTTARL